MGFLKRKYTREYFTGRTADGKRTDYGALGADEWRTGDIFHEIREPIDLLDLTGKRILEIGYGRGESARYMFQKKAIAEYVGVDFSEVAYEIAGETLSSIPAGAWRLEVADALEFMRGQRFQSYFDAAFILDTIEHIPCSEVLELLPLILQSLKSGGFLVVDTPFYGVDEDYIAQGYRFIAPSPTDLHPATKGMHCNKYTRDRIIYEVGSVGFRILDDRKFQKPRFPELEKKTTWLYRCGRHALTPAKSIKRKFVLQGRSLGRRLAQTLRPRDK